MNSKTTMRGSHKYLGDAPPVSVACSWCFHSLKKGASRPLGSAMTVCRLTRIDAAMASARSTAPWICTLSFAPSSSGGKAARRRASSCSSRGKVARRRACACELGIRRAATSLIRGSSAQSICWSERQSSIALVMREMAPARITVTLASRMSSVASSGGRNGLSRCQYCVGSHARRLAPRTARA